MASSSYLSPVILGLLVLLLQIHSSHSLTCSSQTFTSNRLFQNCNDLPHLSSYLHWTYDSSNSSLKIAFVAPPAQPEGWVSWAINPKSTGMAGSQALIAYQANGSVVVDQYDVRSYQSIEKTKISFDLWGVTGEYSDGVMRIFATFALPKNMTTLNQVWQVGASLSGGMPAAHAFKAENLNSKGTLDLMAGTSSTSSGGDSKLTKRNVHGILNAVSWGILFPVGIIIARYIRTFQSADPAWFYLHVSCQIIAYGLGVAGWAIGIKLGNQSKGIQYIAHRNLGIVLFSFATLQMFALFLRPNKDHKYRFYWNIYHHGIGYTILVLGITNVFKGLHILDPAQKWKTAYIVVLIVLGAIALLLEAITWIVVLKKKSDKSTKPYDGTNGADGRRQPLAA